MTYRHHTAVVRFPGNGIFSRFLLAALGCFSREEAELNTKKPCSEHTVCKYTFKYFTRLRRASPKVRFRPFVTRDNRAIGATPRNQIERLFILLNHARSYLHPISSRREKKNTQCRSE